MPEAVIVATARSPIGRANKGSLRDLRPDDLAARASDLATEIASAPASASLETKRRILIERETCWRPLFDAEEQALRAALLGGS